MAHLNKIDFTLLNNYFSPSLAGIIPWSIEKKVRMWIVYVIRKTNQNNWFSELKIKAKFSSRAVSYVKFEPLYNRVPFRSQRFIVQI